MKKGTLVASALGLITSAFLMAPVAAFANTTSNPAVSNQATNSTVSSTNDQIYSSQTAPNSISPMTMTTLVTGPKNPYLAPFGQPYDYGGSIFYKDKGTSSYLQVNLVAQGVGNGNQAHGLVEIKDMNGNLIGNAQGFDKDVNPQAYYWYNVPAGDYQVIIINTDTGYEIKVNYSVQES